MKRNLILYRSTQSSDEVHVAIRRHDFFRLHWHQVCGLQGEMSSQPCRRNPNRSSSSDGGIGDDALRQRALVDAAAASDEARLQHELAVLRAIPRCTGAGESKYTGPNLNKMDVHVRLDGNYLRRSGSAVFDTKLKMAPEVRRQVAAVIGAAAMNMAEMIACPPASTTTAEGAGWEDGQRR